MKVLVGYDGSECAAAALADLTRAGLGSRDVEVRILSVADMLAAAPSAEFAHFSPQAAALLR